MTLALASRGYLCPGHGASPQVPCGPGPTIVASDAVEPEIIAGAAEELPGPSVMEVWTLEPMIVVGDTEQAPPTIEGPDIVGAEDLTPGITGSDEEDD